MGSEPQKNDKELEVVDANSSDYHGARACLDGKYIRVAALNKEQGAKVKKEAITGKEE